MTYFQAVSMQQEMNVALQYRDMFPKRYIEVAKKYTADQWVKCGEAIITKLEEDKVHLFELLALVELARKSNGRG